MPRAGVRVPFRPGPQAPGHCRSPRLDRPEHRDRRRRRLTRSAGTITGRTRWQASASPPSAAARSATRFNTPAESRRLRLARRRQRAVPRAKFPMDHPSHESSRPGPRDPSSGECRDTGKPPPDRVTVHTTPQEQGARMQERLGLQEWLGRLGDRGRRGRRSVLGSAIRPRLGDPSSVYTRLVAVADPSAGSRIGPSWRRATPLATAPHPPVHRSSRSRRARDSDRPARERGAADRPGSRRTPEPAGHDRRPPARVWAASCTGEGCHRSVSRH